MILPRTMDACVFDLAVIGGGPAGIAAAVAAGRLGARVALIEKHDVLGGMGTAALVSNFCNAHFDGQRMIIGGRFAELREALIARDALHVTGALEPYNPADFIEAVDQLCHQAGVTLFRGQALEQVVFTPGQPAQVLLQAGPELLARQIVDASGDAVVAAAAGVPCTVGRPHDGAVMPLTYCYVLGPIDLAVFHREVPEAVMHDRRTGEPYLYLGFQPRARAWVAEARAKGELSIPRDRIAVAFGLPKRPDHLAVNFGRVFVQDPTDPHEMAAADRQGRQQVEEGVRFFQRYVPGCREAGLVELARQIGVRESRQIVGRYTLTADDVLACRQFEDVIAQCCYAIDIHEPDSDRTTMKSLPKGQHYDIPLRCLLPQAGPENLIVAGRSISATHEAMSSFRVTPSVMALGEAAGVAAALACQKSIAAVADVPAADVQTQLIATGGILH